MTLRRGPPPGPCAKIHPKPRPTRAVWVTATFRRRPLSNTRCSGRSIGFLRRAKACTALLCDPVSFSRVGVILSSTLSRRPISCSFFNPDFSLHLTEGRRYCLRCPSARLRLSSRTLAPASVPSFRWDPPPLPCCSSYPAFTSAQSAFFFSLPSRSVFFSCLSGVEDPPYLSRSPLRAHYPPLTLACAVSSSSSARLARRPPSHRWFRSPSKPCPSLASMTMSLPS